MVCLNLVWNIDSFLQELYRWRKKCQDLQRRGRKKKDRSSQGNNGIISPTLSISLHCKWLSTLFWHLEVTGFLQCFQLKGFKRILDCTWSSADTALQWFHLNFPLMILWDSAITDHNWKAKMLQEGRVLSPRHELFLFTMICSRFGKI